MEDNDAINIVIINPCKETCRCRSIIFLHPCPQLLPGAGRELGLSWGWVVCLIVNTNPRYTQHVHITGDPASAFIISMFTSRATLPLISSTRAVEVWPSVPSGKDSQPLK